MGRRRRDLDHFTLYLLRIYSLGKKSQDPLTAAAVAAAEEQPRAALGFLTGVKAACTDGRARGGGKDD